MDGWTDGWTDGWGTDIFNSWYIMGLTDGEWTFLQMVHYGTKRALVSIQLDVRTEMDGYLNSQMYRRTDGQIS